jgi:Uncharacterised nucleotidyltransferase
MTNVLQSRDDIKHLLLDMISTTRPVNMQVMATLNGGDWQDLCTMAGQHRLGPILHHHCQSIGADWVVPGKARARWASAYKQSAIRSLSVRQGLQKLDTILKAVSIPYAALKGSWLSQHAYVHPALRPMRDIDVIVSAGNAIPVFETLREKGYERLHHDDVTPLEFALEHYKHLPPLVCPVSNRTIEIHSRLMADLPDREFVGTIADTDALLNRCIHPSADVVIPYLAPTDTLLHLIVHSAYDHQFNNGPLVMNDIAAMLATTEIDWDRFWTMAVAGGWTRGCQLILAMTKCYHKVLLPTLATETLPNDESVIEAASLLTLLDFEQTSIIRFRKETLGMLWSRRTVKYLWERAFPSRHQLASFSGLPLENNWVWAYFPAWAITRSRQVVFRRVAPDVQADANRAARVEHWLTAES